MNKNIVLWGLLSAVASIPALATSPHFPSRFVAHEWGTFTSLQGSDGHVVDGLHHEDEVLPDFVHSREQAAVAGIAGGNGPGPTPQPSSNPKPWPHCHGKGCDFEPAAGTDLGVTQKMETPVIYFYTPADRDVKVKVGFPGGLITQWYPEASAFSPGAGDVRALANGSTEWNVHLTNATQALPPVAPQDIWAPSREVDAAYVTDTARGEHEKFIFYRGLGRFTTPIEVGSAPGRGLQIRNPDARTVADAFLIRVDGQGNGSFRSLGAVPARGARDVTRYELGAPLAPEAEYLAQASAGIQSALVRSGLYPAEARAMVNTWKRSYLMTPGLRVLYVLPRAWTEKLLPLSLEPAPAELVRTLVGRIEVLTADEEQELLRRLVAAVSSPDQQRTIVDSLGRFAEPKLRRIQGLVAADANSSPELRVLLARLVAEVSNQ